MLIFRRRRGNLFAVGGSNSTAHGAAWYAQATLITGLFMAPGQAAAAPREPASSARAATSAPTLAPPTSGQAAPPPTMASGRSVPRRRLLREAIERYQTSDFTGARQRLERLLAPPADEQRDAATRQAYTYLAFVELAFGRVDQALAAFARALAIDPRMRLRGASPKIARAFEQARRRYWAKLRALDHDPPQLRHQPLARAPHGKPIPMVVKTEDISPVKRVTLNYRTRGDRGFVTMIMEPQSHRRFIASIPASAVVRPGVEYYVAAWDDLGNGPGLKGSADAPIVVGVRDGPPPTANPGPRPWYKKWWVWAIISGAVATAGGVTAAVYLSRQQQARLELRWPRSGP